MKIHYAVILVTTILAATQAQAELCTPRPEQWYRDKGRLVVHQPKLLLVTHISTGFHDDPETIAAVQKTIELLKPNYESVFLHVGGFKNYYYPDCEPTYFYHSTAGEISLDLEAVNEIVMLGGYYSVCLGITGGEVQDAIRRLHVKKDIKITYVIDADFESIQGISSRQVLQTDQIDEITSWLGLTFNYASLARQFSKLGQTPEELQTLLTSEFENSSIPSAYGIYAHLKNHYWKTKEEWIEWTVQAPPKPNGPSVQVYFVESRDLTGLARVR